MALTFDRARSIVFDTVSVEWVPESGTLMVAADGREDAESFLVTVGPREWLVDADTDFCPPGMPMAMFVDKQTGSTRWFVALPGQPDWDRVEAMTPIR